MAAIMVPNSQTGQYATQYRVVQAPQPGQQPQQTRIVQIQRPANSQQVVIQQGQSPYSQQTVQQQQQPIIQTRIVHTTPQHVQAAETSTPTRQFVTFKNLRHLNAPGAQWDHCEHVTMELSADELEKKIRLHERPGNDLVTILSSMGLFRQRHLKKYGDKLNQKEADPSNWSWVLEALGELKEKHKSTPHTFWAIFKKIAKRNVSKPHQPEVLVHHEPVQLFETAPVHTISSASVPVVPALPPPQPMLALPAPPMQSQPTYGQAIIQPARSIGGSSASSYHTHGSRYSTNPQAQQQYENQQQPARFAQDRSQPSYISGSRPQQAQVYPHRPMESAAHPASRQITQGPSHSNTTTAPKRQYTRPIPQPVNPVTGRTNNPGQFPSYTRTSDIDLHQFRNGESSPNREYPPSPYRERRGWLDDDSMSDDSSSSFGSSSCTSLTDDYSIKRRPAPLGGSLPKNGTSTQNRRKNADNSRSREPRMLDDRAYLSRSYTASSGPAAEPVSAPRPVIHRQDTIELKFGLGGSAPRPAPLGRSHTDATPRSYPVRQNTGDVDYDGESDGPEDRRNGNQRRNGGTARRHTTMPSSFRNSYEAGGLVSYGNDNREGGRRL